MTDELRQREPRMRCEAYLDHIRSMPCLICANNIATEAAHLSIGNREIDKPPTGGAEKASDKWALPLCGEHHREQHAGAELAFWRKYKLDPFAIAMRLWTAWKATTGYVEQIRRPKPRSTKRNVKNASTSKSSFVKRPGSAWPRPNPDRRFGG